MFEPHEIIIEPYPKPKDGMSTGRLPAGVKITHRSTGLCVVANRERDMYSNRKVALEKLEQLVKDFLS